MGDDERGELGVLLERSRALREAACRLRREVEAREATAAEPPDGDREAPAP